MSGPPQLPPFGFGMAGSPFPPHPTSRNSTPRQSHSATFTRAVSPPPASPALPNLSQEARQQELQWQQQKGYACVARTSSQYPQRPNETSAASFAPGQLVTPQFMHSPAPADSGRRDSSFIPPPHRAPSPHIGHGIYRSWSAAPTFNGYRSVSAGPLHTSSRAAIPPAYGSVGTSQHDVAASRSRHLEPCRQLSQSHHFAAQGVTHRPSGGCGENLRPDSSNDSVSLPLTMPLSDMALIYERREKALGSGQEQAKLEWAKLVVRYVERVHSDATNLTDATLIRYVDEAMAVINRRANATPPDLHALFLRGDLRTSGNFPSYHRKDPKNAFNDFELSGRMGYPASWFRIGRDYETLGDVVRARDAYSRGKGYRDVGCIYRLGMAHLLGQIGFQQDYPVAIRLLREAADLSNDDTPQPSYIFGMLFAGEFAHLNIPAYLLAPIPDPTRPHQPASAERTALQYIERAAYLNFAPAQYKLGWAYEYAQLDCAFDPLLSVQYYSLASKGGEVEADMAVSKWFLCGAEGCFDRNESLAYTFAEKAARKGLPSAEFGLAYYHEVGVGCQQNVSVARKWYKKASAHGNTDAAERLEALSSSSACTLSRSEHEAHLDSKLERKHTAARLKSDYEGRGNRPGDRPPNPPRIITTGFEHLSLKGHDDDNDRGGRLGAVASPRQTMKMVNDAAGAPSAQVLSQSISGIPNTVTSPRRGLTTQRAHLDTSPHLQWQPPCSRVMSSSGSGLQSRDQTAGPSSSASASISASSQMHIGREVGSDDFNVPTGYTLYESYAPIIFSSGYSDGGAPSTTISSGPSTSAASIAGGSDMASQLSGPMAAHRHESSAASAGASLAERRRSSEAKRYSTFAEMGFQSASAGKDKECVIM